DRIIVQSPGFKRVLVERGVPGGRIEVVYNWANESEARARPNCDLATFALGGRFNVVYAGTIGPTQGLDTVLRAAKLIEESESRVQFILVGGGIEVERLRALATDIGTTAVKIMPRLQPSEIGSLLAAADLLFVHLKDESVFRITIPSKIQFYLAMGKPILMGLRGDAAELIEKARAGVIIEPQDARALANAVLELAHLPKHDLAAIGARGRVFYERELSAAVGVGRTLAVLDSALTARRRGLILKRVFDIVVAGIALVLSTPVILVTGAALWIDHRSAVFFRQTRPGLDGKPFCIYKLRTRKNATNQSGHPLPDAEGFTPLAWYV